MGFISGRSKRLPRLESKPVAIFRKSATYGGILTYVDGLPYVHGLNIREIDGYMARLMPVRKGDAIYPLE